MSDKVNRCHLFYVQFRTNCSIIPVIKPITYTYTFDYFAFYLIINRTYTYFFYMTGNISGVDSKTGVIVGAIVGTSVIVGVAILIVFVTRRYNISLACNVERKG